MYPDEVATPQNEFERIEFDIRASKLRAAVAFTARCGKRVFPLVRRAGLAVDCFAEALAAAEAFATGEPGSRAQAKRVAEIAASSVPAELRLRGGERAAVDTVVAAANAAAAGFDAEAFRKVSYAVIGEIHRREIAEPAVSAVRSFRQAIMAEAGDLKAADFEARGGPPSSAHDVYMAGGALSWDAGILRGNYPGFPLLGPSVDPSSSGPFGHLWPIGMPSWAESESPAVVGDIITASDWESRIRPDGSAEAMPDTICWHLGSDLDGEPWRNVRKLIRTTLDMAHERGQVPPGLAVHATSLSAHQRYELVELGAVVYDDEEAPFGINSRPTNADEFRTLLLSHMGAIRSKWSRDRLGNWVSTAAAHTWRGDVWTSDSAAGKITPIDASPVDSPAISRPL